MPKTKATAKVTAKKSAAPAKKATKKPAAKKASKKAPETTPAEPAAVSTPREGSKKGLVIGLIERPDGATRSELAQATEWTEKFVHGFVSWTVAKHLEKTGRALDASKDKETGNWTYKVKQA